MKIIIWNCHFGGFETKDKKIDAVLPLKPDVLVVPECEEVQNSATRHWIGDETGYGLAVYTFGDYRLSLLPSFDPGIRLVMPLKISNGKTEFTLLAVWTKEYPDAKPFVPYVMQTWNALQKYEKSLGDDRFIMAGDFNSTPTVEPKSAKDAEGNKVNHERIVEFLAGKGIHSAYHRHFGEQHGEEKQPTHYWTGKKDKPFHLDYCFVSASLLDCLKAVEVGTFDEWHKYSDHMPLIVDFDL